MERRRYGCGRSAWSICLFILVLTAGPLFIPTDHAAAAPVPPFTRWGVAKLDGIPLMDGVGVYALIDGTPYCLNRTYSGDGSFVLKCPGQDTDVDDVKCGGVQGEGIIYFLRNGNDTWIAKETDVFSTESGIANTTDLLFYSRPQPNFLTINEIVPEPDDGGPDYVFINNPSFLMEDMGAWRLEDSAGWSMSLSGLAAPKQGMYVELDGKELEGDGGELKLAWRTGDPLVAGGDRWLVMDRVEWGNMAEMGRNTLLPDFSAEMGPGQSMIRRANGSDSDDCNVDFQLRGRCTPRPMALVSGRVSDDWGLPMGNIAITADRWNNAGTEEKGAGTEELEAVSSTSDGAGRFNLRLKWGTYNITAGSKGYEIYRETIELGPGDEHIMEITLRPSEENFTGILGGTAGDEEGILEGVVITATNVTSGAERRTVSDHTGGYELHLAEGLYDVKGQMEGYLASTYDGLYVGAGELTRLDMLFSRTGVVNGSGSGNVANGWNGTLRGRVVDSTGRGIPDCSIRYKNMSTGEVGEELCDSEGRYSVKLKPGDYLVYAEMEGYIRGVRLATVGEEGTAILNFVLHEEARACALTVKVTDGKGRSTEGADIRLYRDDLLYGEGRSGDRGEFVFSGLSPGTYHVVVEKEGYLPFSSAEVVLDRGETEQMEAILTEKYAGTVEGQGRQSGSEWIWLYLAVAGLVVIMFVGIFIISKKDKTNDEMGEENKDSKK